MRKMRFLYVLALGLLTTSISFAAETNESENIQLGESCEALFGNAKSAEAFAQAKENRVLRLSVSELNAGKNEVFLEHGVATWRTPMPLHYEFLDVVRVVRSSDLAGLLASEAAVENGLEAESDGDEFSDAGLNDAGLNDAGLNDAGLNDAEIEEDAGVALFGADESFKAEQTSPFSEDPWVAIVELKTDLAGCSKGQYALQMHDAIGQGTRIIDVFPQGVLLDRDEELLFMQNHQVVGENAQLTFQLTWISPFQLIVDEGAKGLKSGSSKKKRKKKSRKKRKKSKKKSRKKRRKRKK